MEIRLRIVDNDGSFRKRWTRIERIIDERPSEAKRRRVILFRERRRRRPMSSCRRGTVTFLYLRRRRRRNDLVVRVA